jgi:pimeloyl-ACP methyl ester carboxylesterase
VDVVQGQADPFVPYQFGQHLAANLPNATLHQLPEKGHLLPFSAEFRAWLFGRADSLRGKVPGK